MVTNLETSTRQELRLIRDADGYRQLRANENGQEYVVRAQAFEKWFGSRLRIRRVLEWLDAEGLLDHDRARTTKRSNEWAQKQVTWPDGTRVRSISIYLPNEVADLDLDG